MALGSVKNVGGTALGSVSQTSQAIHSPEQCGVQFQVQNDRSGTEDPHSGCDELVEDYHLPVATSIPTPPILSPESPKPLHFSKWNQKVIESAIANNQLVSAYVENIPQRWLPTDIHLVMNRFAEVMDVFAPQKKSRAGKRYAFVRFRNTVNMSAILDCINSMLVDGVYPASLASNKSFVDAVRTSQDRKQAPTPQNSPNNAPVFVSKAGAPNWLCRCALGVLKKPMPINCLLDLFLVDESPITDVIPLGGLFDEFRGWWDVDAAFNRLCWVLIRGVPPHLWSRDFFEVLASNFGSMVDWSNNSRNRSRFDLAEVLILTSSNAFIDKVLSVKAGDTQFQIGVAESHFKACRYVADPTSEDVLNPRPILSNRTREKGETDSDICRVNKRILADACSSSDSIPISFTNVEVQETNNVGNLIGWDRSRCVNETDSPLGVMVTKEAFEWVQSRAQEGLCSSSKQTQVGYLINQYHCNFSLLCETKGSAVDLAFCHKVWGDGRIEFASVNSDGRAGGLILIWDTDFFKSNCVVSSRS
ncbi:hypothetical protein Tsubulata_047869 [Turnera subulata]|uniref:RRM domain-containing protein n=1 Tax=Turnera subulata TaxID=218843 RepID=A0A9Q0JJV4_9ROSI|nr:hypothetical protein Tsubulata_047869 [Turnera subulata]